MSPKKRPASRSIPQDLGTRPTRATRRGGRATAYRDEDDGRRRNVTFAIIGAGILIAFLVVMSSVEKGNVANAPTQPANAQAVDANAAALQERLRQNPADQVAMIDLGNTYYDAKRYGEAIPWYEKALEKVPTDTNVRTDLGTAYFYSGNVDKAKEQWTKVLQQDPNKVQTHYNLGILYSSLTPPDTESAAKEWEAVLKIAPGSEQGKSAEEKLKAMGRR